MALIGSGGQSRKRDWLPFVLLFIAVTVLLLDYRGGIPSPKSWLSQTTMRLQKGANALLQNLGNAGAFFRNLEELKAENEALRLKVEDLTVQLAALDEAVAENEVLRRELGFAQTYRVLGLRGADVTGIVAAHQPGNLIRAITIDVGSAAGLLPDMAVVTGRGLVGRIVRVDGSLAEVMLITDSRSAVAALVQRTRVGGLLRGQLDGTLLMEGINRDADIEVGDIILTSGLGGVFPKGVVVGWVREVRRSDTAMFQSAVITPSVDLDSLEVVLIVTHPDAELAPEAPPAPEDGEAAEGSDGS